jgi:hypothetical protein
MSNEDEDYFDDPEMLDFDDPETLEARAVAEETDPNEAFGLKIFGPTGRGSPAMGRQSPYQLSRNAAASLRRLGLDESHLKDTTAWDTKLEESQPQPRPRPQKQEKAVVVKAEVRPMVKAKPRPENRNQFSDNDKYDKDAQDAADKLWLRMGHLPLRHRVGEEYEKMMQERSRPQRNNRPERNKGGTRKRSARRSRRAYKKRTMRKRTRKYATRRRR